MEISWGLSRPPQEANLSCFSGDPGAPLASNKPDADWMSTWPFVNPGPQRGNLDTITLTRAPNENEFLMHMFRKKEEREKEMTARQDHRQMNLT